MNHKLKNKVFETFKLSPNRIMELMDSIEKKNLLETRFIMDEIITEYKDNNSLENLLYTENEIANHNIIVENINAMEGMYSDYMVFLEKNKLVEA